MMRSVRAMGDGVERMRNIVKLVQKNFAASRILAVMIAAMTDVASEPTPVTIGIQKVIEIQRFTF